MTRRIVVGFSGGVTSAWAAAWALRVFPASEVDLLFHDTKAEDSDTYRFRDEVAAALHHPWIERSDGRSVAELELDECALANNRMAFCSRILKAEQKERYFAELRESGVTDIVNVLGFTSREWQRVQRQTVNAERNGYTVLFPLVPETTKQMAADWCVNVLHVPLPRMYAWSDHANCVGCRRGGKAYWLAVKQNRPDIFQAAIAHEANPLFNSHSILKCGTLTQLTPLKRTVNRKESIEINCECGS